MKYSDSNTGVADSKWLSLFTFIIRVLIIIIKVVYLLFTCSMMLNSYPKHFDEKLIHKYRGTHHSFFHEHVHSRIS